MGRWLHVRRYDRRNRQRVLRLYFDDRGELRPKDAEKWARSVASEWGEINVQQKVRASGLPGPAWLFSCSEHGGYILVAPAHKVPEALHRFAADGTLVWNKGWVEMYGGQYNEINVFRFEENCDWAVFETVWPDAARWSVYNREKEWATSPRLDEERAALASWRLKSPLEMRLQVKERLRHASELIRHWKKDPELQAWAAKFAG